MGLLIMMGIFAFGVIIGIPVAFALGIGAVSAFYFEGLPLIICDTISQSKASERGSPLMSSKD